MANVMRVGAIVIYAHGPKALAEWYGDMLGIEIGFNKVYKIYFGAIIDPATSRKIMIGFMDWNETSRLGTHPVMVNFQIDDFDGYSEALTSKGTPMRNLIEDANGRFGYITDPEGNPIEIWQEFSPQSSVA